MTSLRQAAQVAAPEVASTDAFLCCDQCFEVHRITEADQAPEFADDGHEIPHNDLEIFRHRHSDHPLRWLHRCGEAETHSHPRHDPARQVTWQLVDSEGHFSVVSCCRNSIFESRRYELKPGRLILASETVTFDRSIFRALINEALSPIIAPEGKIVELTTICERRLAQLTSNAFEVIDEDRKDPNIQLACLPLRVSLALEAGARLLFPGINGERLVDLFSHDLRLEIPIVRIKRAYEIKPE